MYLRDKHLLNDLQNNCKIHYLLQAPNQDLWLTDTPVFLPFRDEPVPHYLHRANNAPLDKNAINLAEIPVFERCFKYGTSPDYIPKKIKETPEMIVSVKLYA